MDETTPDGLRGERLLAKIEAARSAAQWAVRGALGGSLMRRQAEGITLTEASEGLPLVRVIDATPEDSETDYQLFGLVDGKGRLVGGYDLHWNIARSSDGIGTYQIGTVEVSDELRGKDDGAGQRIPGIGRKLYSHIATQSPPPADAIDGSMTYYLVSSGNMNEASTGVWNRLVADGEAAFVPGRGYQYLQPNIHTLPHAEPAAG